MTNFRTMERQFATNTANANRLNKKIVFAALCDAGTTKVVIGFDGETDSGQIDGISAFRDVFWFSVKMSEEFRRRKDSALRAGIFKA